MSEICECFESEYIVTQYGVKCIRCNKFKAKSEICECEHDHLSLGWSIKEGKETGIVIGTIKCKEHDCPCKKFKAKIDTLEVEPTKKFPFFRPKNHSPLTNPELDSVSRIDEDTLRGSVKKDCTNCKEHIEKWLKGEAAPFICELCGATYDEVYKGSDNSERGYKNGNKTRKD